MKTAFTTYATKAAADGHHDLAKRLRAEGRACGYLIRECLRRGLVVSINDGGEWCLLRCSNYNTIMCALASTDGDTVHVRHPGQGLSVGSFYLVYGNSGPEVIADYSDNPACNAIMTAIQPRLDALENNC
jgi:hypothetical protein